MVVICAYKTRIFPKLSPIFVAKLLKMVVACLFVVYFVKIEVSLMYEMGTGASGLSALS